MYFYQNEYVNCDTLSKFCFLFELVFGCASSSFSSSSESPVTESIRFGSLGFENASVESKFAAITA